MHAQLGREGAAVAVLALHAPVARGRPGVHHRPDLVAAGAAHAVVAAVVVAGAGQGRDAEDAQRQDGEEEAPEGLHGRLPSPSVRHLSRP